jgi:hypothetical protein
LPTTYCKRTREEQVISCFQSRAITHNTGVIWQEEPLSLQHGSSIQSVMKEQPKKILYASPDSNSSIAKK